jgi:hypothetical protein
VKCVNVSPAAEVFFFFRQNCIQEDGAMGRNDVCRWVTRVCLQNVDEAQLDATPTNVNSLSRSLQPLLKIEIYSSGLKGQCHEIFDLMFFA